MSRLSDQMNAERAKVLALEVRLASALAEVARLRAALQAIDGMLSNSGDDFDKVPAFGVILEALRSTSAKSTGDK